MINSFNSKQNMANIYPFSLIGSYQEDSYLF